MPYPVQRQGTSINAIPRLEKFKPVRQSNKREKDLINGKIVRQRSLRHKTTILKAGTHCHKTSTELLTFRKIEFQSVPAQLMNIMFRGTNNVISPVGKPDLLIVHIDVVPFGKKRNIKARQVTIQILSFFHRSSASFFLTYVIKFKKVQH